MEEIDHDITAEFLSFAGSSRRIIGERNWMSLTFDKDRLWAEWWVEEEDERSEETEQTPYTKVIHPLRP